MFATKSVAHRPLSSYGHHPEPLRNVDSQAPDLVNQDLPFNKIPCSSYLQYSLRNADMGDNPPNTFFPRIRDVQTPCQLFPIGTLMAYTALGLGKLFPPSRKSLPYITKSVTLNKSFIKGIYAPESR